MRRKSVDGGNGRRRSVVGGWVERDAGEGSGEGLH